MPGIRDFSGGVVNQELQNRDNGNGVLFDCKNVLSSWNGELRKRTGTTWLAKLPEYQRIIPYRLPSGDDIILLLSDNTISGYTFINEGEIKPFYIYSGEIPSFPTSGWTGVLTNGDYTISMRSSTSETITDQGSAFNAHTGTGYAGEGANWGMLYRSTANVRGYIEIQSENAQLFNSAILRWTNSCNGNHPRHYKGWLEPIIQYSDDGNTWVSVQTDMSNPMPTGGADYYSASHVFSTTTENYIVYKVTNINHDTPHLYWRILCNSRITNTQTYDNERLDLAVSNVTYLPNNRAALIIDTSSYFEINENNIDGIKFAQSDTLMILTNGTDSPCYLQYAGGAMNSGTYITTLSSNQGQPSCVCFYQNRLWFGGFSAFPTRVWGSAFGNFTDFTIPTTDILSTSPISADSVEIKSRIENMWGGNNALYCLSEDGISMIDAQGGIVATNQIEFKLRNREPVNNMTPTYKDDIMVYLGRDKRKILITDYDLVVQRFKAHNISENYTDFLQAGIRELHYIPGYNSLIYGLLDGGKWFALLLDLDKGKNALYPFDTYGSIFDIQPIKHDEKTYLVLITQRNGLFMLEQKLFSVDQKIMDFMSKTEKEEYTKDTISSQNAHLDCCIKRHLEGGNTQVQDIPYAVGTDVDVVVNGNYIGKRTVNVHSVQLYSWKYSNDYLYTNTTTPSTNSVLYDSAGDIIPDYSIVSVNTNSINVSSGEIRSVIYFAYGYQNSITIHPNSGYSGTFTRDTANDGVITYITSSGRSVTLYAFAWTQGTQTIYTLAPNTSTGQRWLVDGQSTSYSGFIASVSTINKVYTKQPLAENNTVYDEHFSVLGSVGHVYEEITTSGIRYTSFSFDNKVFYSTDGHISREEIITRQYVRNSESDILTNSNYINISEETSEDLDVVIGYTYDSYAVLKFVSPYNLRKFPKEISVNFINTGYLEVGNTFDSLKSVLNNLVESVSISNKQILMNGNYTKTLDKQTFETPYVILRSDKPMPFIITGIDYKVDMSNYQGGV